MNRVRANVTDIRLALVQPIDLGAIDVEPNYREATLAGRAQQRQPDVTKADHANYRGAPVQARREREGIRWRRSFLSVRQIRSVIHTQRAQLIFPGGRVWYTGWTGKHHTFFTLAFYLKYGYRALFLHRQTGSIDGAVLSTSIGTSTY
jgi:hypothetical protein